MHNIASFCVHKELTDRQKSDRKFYADNLKSELVCMGDRRFDQNAIEDEMCVRHDK